MRGFNTVAPNQSYFTNESTYLPIQDIAAAALFLASKLEEHPIRIRDLINCFDYLIKLVDFEAQQLELERISGTPIASSSVYKFNYKPMDYFAKEYYDWKDDIVIAESQILKVSFLLLSCVLVLANASW